MNINKKELKQRNHRGTMKNNNLQRKQKKNNKQRKTFIKKEKL